MEKAYLVLSNGMTFEGQAIGARGESIGELVFTTGMVGYLETLTDPSYAGQIIMQTFPLIGNYGVIPEDFEGDCFAKGYVVRELCDQPSNFRSQYALDKFLKDKGICGICGVDTRQITRIIREEGVMNAGIFSAPPADLSEIQAYSCTGVVAQVSHREKRIFPAQGQEKFTVALIDYGAKQNIIRCLCDRDATVIRVPWDYDFTQLEYDGVMLSNGPGDPQQCGATVANIKKAIALGKPIFGICLGNQLLSIAAGATTFKLKYGHRSHNQPALMVGTDRAVITSQNHGFAVDTTTLDEGWEPYFVNLNDGTSEGIRHRTKPFFSVQFHPEASGGPVDTEFLFDDFIQNIEKCRK